LAKQAKANKDIAIKSNAATKHIYQCGNVGWVVGRMDTNRV